MPIGDLDRMRRLKRESYVPASVFGSRRDLLRKNEVRWSPPKVNQIISAS